MKQKVSSLEEAIGVLADKLSMPELRDLINESDHGTHPSFEDDLQNESTADGISNNHVLSTWEVVMDPDTGPAAIPASVVSTFPRNESLNLVPNGDRSRQDLITRGVVSLESAKCFSQVYFQKLDHLLYRVLKDHDSLSSIRASSPLLTAAVCTVGALHSSSTEFDACYEDFMKLCTAQVFNKKNTADEVRALCIGAFWLSDVSWTLVGLGQYS
jgi:hypothetical protein